MPPTDEEKYQEYVANKAYLTGSVDPVFTPLLKALLKEKPADVNDFCAKYFAEGGATSAGPETAEKGARPAVVEKKAVPKAKKGATRKERPPGSGMVCSNPETVALLVKPPPTTGAVPPKPPKPTVKGAETKEKLGDGVEFLTFEDSDTGALTFKVKNLKMNPLKFTVDTSGSEGVALGPPKAWQQGVATVTAGHNEVALIGTMEAASPGAAWSSSMGFSWEFLPPDKAAVQKVVDENAARVEAACEVMRGKGIKASDYSSAAALRAAIKAAGLPPGSFVDTEFMPGPGAAFNEPGANPNQHSLIWLKAEETEDTPKLFEGGILPTDICQGALGDCWFLAALATLTEFPHLVTRLFGKQTHESAEGIYEVRAYKQGMPVTILIDDYFPCDPVTGKLAYSKTNGNEIWVALLEKAWAKLHGSYEQIESGNPGRAVCDLTGCTGDFMDFDDAETQAKISQGILFDELAKLDAAGALLCATTPGVDTLTKGGGGGAGAPSTGLVPGHAYTLLTAKEGPGGVKLVRLRNPWGSFEWTGAFSDESDAWTPELVDFFQPNRGSADGTFWMLREDFNAHFNGVQYCHQRAGAGGPSWAEARFSLDKTAGPEGAPGAAAPGAAAPEGPAHTSCVAFTCPDACPSGFITLSQKDMRLRGTEKYIFVGMVVYKCDDNGAAASEVIRAQLESDRDLVLPLPPLDKGKYLVVVFNPDLIPGRDLYLALHLNPNCLEGNTEALLGQIEESAAAEGVRKAPELEARKEAFAPTEEAGFKAALATALTGPDVEFEDYDDLLTSAAFTASGGYVLAAKAPSDCLEVDFDFGSSEGLTLLKGPRECKQDGMVVTVGLTNEWKLIAEFAPLPGGAEVSVGMELAY
eukprot:CAMPEP_0172646344 /NCGR_PEP_ID=MMETSP1068-20121228/240191_1 /TAXON_ID=35684 /ORGANISM="Pseudopedinella elastica, Strain CCMP716" /LENGTH=866 /DNA_ID=CAMNT_0013460601 /DNA_START=1 /DNA_END=2601 /DNA_ORIENTATION=-